jgi:hypothetical protein
MEASDMITPLETQFFVLIVVLPFIEKKVNQNPAEF